MAERDRQRDAVDLARTAAEQVARVVAECEHRGAGLADPLAVEELRVERRCVEDARVRDLLGVSFARPLGSASTNRTRMPLVEQDTDDRSCPCGPPPKITMSSTRRCSSEIVPAPGPRSVRRADDDDPVADVDRLVAARDDHARRRG